jgi:hypothetical protein
VESIAQGLPFQSSEETWKKKISIHPHPMYLCPHQFWVYAVEIITYIERKLSNAKSLFTQKSAGSSSTAAKAGSTSYTSTMFHVKKCMYFKCVCGEGRVLQRMHSCTSVSLIKKVSAIWFCATCQGHSP